MAKLTREDFISALKEMTILEVKELLGHTSSKTTEKYYLTVFPEDKKDAAELLSKLIQIPSREIVGK